MEYEVKLPELGEGNMYNYWRSRQTELLIDEVKKSDNILINLASQEIQGAYDWKKVGSTVRIITPEFKVWKDGKAQTIVIYMKMARGQMTRYILKTGSLIRRLSKTSLGKDLPTTRVCRTRTTGFSYKAK